MKKPTIPVNFWKRISAHHATILFIIILIIGLYLRFYRIENVFTFGWDQGRDAFKVKDIIEGQLVLDGPRTGIGDFHLGPLYYYLLTPFFLLTHLDPMAENYFNVLVNIFNFGVIFWVTKRLFSSDKIAIFTIFLYAFNHYLIRLNQIPWNVSAIPGITFLLLYSLYQVLEGRYQWFLVVATLTGIFFQLHFTAIFMVFIVAGVLVFVRKKLRALRWLLISLPFFLVWLLPTFIFNQTHYQTDYYKYLDFIRYYFVGFHLRWLLHRLPDAVIMFGFLLHFPFLNVLKIVLPLLFTLVILFEQDKRKKRLGWLLLIWLAAPLIGFTLYGGPLSDYYFLITLPAAMYVLVYLQQKLLQWKFVPVLIILVFFWGYYLYDNTRDLWRKPTSGGLAAQKQEVRRRMTGEVFPYVEGDIKAYLYTIWTQGSKH